MKRALLSTASDLLERVGFLRGTRPGLGSFSDGLQELARIEQARDWSRALEFAKELQGRYPDRDALDIKVIVLERELRLKQSS